MRMFDLLITGINIHIKQTEDMNRSLIRLTLVLALGIFLVGCSSSLSDSVGDISADTAALSNSGAWKVSLYSERGKNETSDYNSFEFYFDDQGVFRAVNSSGASYTGSWSRTTDDGLPRLVIRITGTKDLEELDDDWVLDAISDTKIELSDDNLTSAESLHFEKL